MHTKNFAYDRNYSGSGHVWWWRLPLWPEFTSSVSFGSADVSPSASCMKLDTLARRRIALVTTDPYGIPETKAWNRELRHFITKVIRPALSDENMAALAPDGDVVGTVSLLIEERVCARA